MRNTASTIGGRDAQSLDFLDGMLDAMERESGLVVVGDGGVLAAGEIGPVQRAAGGRPVPGARLRATHPAHVGGKRVFAQANLDFRFGVMRVVEPHLPFHILDACATVVQIGHHELDRDHLSAPAPGHLYVGYPGTHLGEAESKPTVTRVPLTAHAAANYMIVICVI